MDYVIYVFIGDHIRRLYYDLNIIVPQYEFDNEKQKLLLKKDRFYKHTFLYKDFGLFKYKMATNKEKSKLFCAYVKQMNEKSKQLYPNSEFVIVIYDWTDEVNWDDVENEGIKLININIDGKYNDNKYRAMDNIHPNGEAWREITPLVIKELNL